MLTSAVVRHAYGGMEHRIQTLAEDEDDSTLDEEQLALFDVFDVVAASGSATREQLCAWEKLYVEEGRVTRAFLYNVLWSPDRPDVRSCRCDDPDVSLGLCRECQKPQAKEVRV